MVYPIVIYNLKIVIVDVLLCHDDELDTRRIAFAFYLVPLWTKDDGGLLDLFDMDGK
jgi:Rps23 Pro-64 3,4-dihydroxylase Tpa1-like proline 4-hydroxylase